MRYFFWRVYMVDLNVVVGKSTSIYSLKSLIKIVKVCVLLTGSSSKCDSQYKGKVAQCSISPE